MTFVLETQEYSWRLETYLWGLTFFFFHCVKGNEGRGVFSTAQGRVGQLQAFKKDKMLETEKQLMVIKKRLQGAV